ncbi:hypothetical protein FJZ33_02530 [Candidatus Poribacteria bacterium]|nr:hypothetical protein [Candidatus Poribacteria bacterium]
MENPILIREIKLRLRTRKLIAGMILRFAFLGFFFLLILLSHIGKGILAVVLSEALLLLLFSSGTIFASFSGESNRRDLLSLSLTRLSSFSIFWGKFLGASLYNSFIIFLSASTMIIISLLDKKLHIQSLIFAHLGLIIISFASSVIGLAFSNLGGFKGAFLAYIVIFLLIGSVIIPGPALTRIDNHEVKSLISKIALHANPFVMLSRSLGKIDIMRTQYLYQVADPVVGPGFTYPDWRYVAFLYLLVSILIFTSSYLVFIRRKYND